MKIETLRDLFTIKIMALYDIETQLTKALPKMAKAATDPGLKEAFKKHHKETEGHVKRLEEIFDILDEKPQKMKVEAIRGLVADAEWIINEDPSEELLDAVLLASARYVEHYEMAGYLSAIAWAETLGLDDAIELLEDTLDEERSADMKLSEAAKETINPMAAEAEGSDDKK